MSYPGLPVSFDPSAFITKKAFLPFLDSLFDILCCLFIVLISLSSYSQEILAEPKAYGWSGGINSCQFCSIDLDLDGINDLLIFDRHGNRKLPFLFNGLSGTLDYSLEPALAEKLPDLHDWVITADYNHDGRMDIFTYSNGGARIFRNTSDTALSFALVTDLLVSWYYTGYVGILITSVDYPAITDIDGDGDLDLLTFFGLGSWVEYHRNLSVEKYGHPDTLDFRLEDLCWGKFKESEGSNKITLNADCPYNKGGEMFTDGPKHTGSTMLATDLNGDGLMDLILGDVDFPGLIALYNGGTPDSAFMVEMDTLFPVNDKPVHLFSFPCAFLIDLDHDGLNDLVVSPYDPALNTSDNFSSVWWYRNTGTPTQPNFQFRTDRLFQDEMLDFGSNTYPLLYDLNQDGMIDLITGSLGYYDTSYYSSGILKTEFTSHISWFRNEGNSERPFFRRMTDDLGYLDTFKLTGLFPAAGDLTGDGSPDLITGNSDGTLVFLPNKHLPGEVPQFGPPQFNYADIDVGENSTPQLFDLDKDGLTDLIIGERGGNLNFYRNVGTVAQPQFNLITDSLGKINVTDPLLSYDGYSTPFFFRNQKGETNLVVGSESGKTWYFTGIDKNLSGAFQESDSLSFLIGVNVFPFETGWRTSASLGRLSSPSYFDLIIGNFSGGLQYVSHELHPGLEENILKYDFYLFVYPNPADRYVRIVEGRRKTSLTEPLTVEKYEGRGTIVNVVGEVIMEFTFRNNMTLNTTELPDGLYVIHLPDKSSLLMIQHY